MRWRLALVLLALWLAAPAVAAAAPGELLSYRWRLNGLLGGLAALFVPSQGEAQLTTTVLPSGHQVSELLLTAKASRGDEFFRYGAELDLASGITVRAWSSYRWRGESKSKEEAIGRQGVIDIASGIAALRRDPPSRARHLEIWSDGKIYPVIVLPLERSTRRLGGESIPVRHYAIRGRESPGKKPWKGAIGLWLAERDGAVPLEIEVERSLAAVALRLLPPPPAR